VAFRLARVLRLYEHQEQQRLMELRQARVQRDKHMRLVSFLETRLAEGGVVGVDPGAGNHQVAGIDLYQGWVYRRALLDRLFVARRDLGEAEHAVNQAMESFTASRRQRKTVQILGERYAEQQKMERAREEQGQLDEAGLRTYLLSQNLYVQ